MPTVTARCAVQNSMDSRSGTIEIATASANREKSAPSPTTALLASSAPLKRILYAALGTPKGLFSRTAPRARRSIGSRTERSDRSDAASSRPQNREAGGRNGVGSEDFLFYGLFSPLVGPFHLRESAT